MKMRKFYCIISRQTFRGNKILLDERLNVVILFIFFTFLIKFNTVISKYWWNFITLENKSNLE